MKKRFLSFFQVLSIQGVVDGSGNLTAPLQGGLANAANDPDGTVPMTEVHPSYPTGISEGFGAGADEIRHELLHNIGLAHPNLIIGSLKELRLGWRQADEDIIHNVMALYNETSTNPVIFNLRLSQIDYSRVVAKIYKDINFFMAVDNKILFQGTMDNTGLIKYYIPNKFLGRKATLFNIAEVDFALINKDFKNKQPNNVLNMSRFGFRAQKLNRFFGSDTPLFFYSLQSIPIQSFGEFDVTLVNFTRNLNLLSRQLGINFNS